MGKHSGLQGRLHIEVDRHGMDWSQFGLLLREQDFSCACCSRQFQVDVRMHIDHDEAGFVRGILCTKCINNQWLPFQYLEFPPASSVFEELPRMQPH